MVDLVQDDYPARTGSPLRAPMDPLADLDDQQRMSALLNAALDDPLSNPIARAASTPPVRNNDIPSDLLYGVNNMNMRVFLVNDRMIKVSL